MDGAQHFLQDCMCMQRRLKAACTSAQSDQSSKDTLLVAKDPKSLQAYREYSDQTARMRWAHAVV